MVKVRSGGSTVPLFSMTSSYCRGLGISLFYSYTSYLTIEKIQQLIIVGSSFLAESSEYNSFKLCSLYVFLKDVYHDDILFLLFPGKSRDWEGF